MLKSEPKKEPKNEPQEPRELGFEPCPRCGADVRIDQEFCPSCGKRLCDNCS